MRITGIIFDFDGTLIDSIPAHKKVIRKVARRHGIIITDEAFARYNGMSTRVGFTKIMREHHLYFGALKMLMELYKAKQDVLKHLRIFPQTKPALEALNNDYAMAVATSSNRKYLHDALSRFELHNYFQALLSADDVRHAKPSPEIFLKAAQALEKEPEECVVIEDSLNGIIAAKRAGMIAIAVLSSTPKELFVGEAEPDAFIEDLSGLTPARITRAWSKAHVRRQVEEK